MRHLFSLIFIIGFIFLSFFLFKDIDSKADEIYKTMQNNIGEEVIIRNDTLMVVDFSFLDANYILDNGTTIHMDLYDKVKIIK